MNLDSFISIGKVTRAHGLRGDFFVHLFSQKAPWIDDLKSFYLLCNKSQNVSHYEIEKWAFHKKGIIIKAFKVDSKEQADEVKNCDFLVEKTLLGSPSLKEFYLEQILNFNLYNNNHLVGLVHSLSSNGVQDLLVVLEGKKEHLIPFVKEWIDDIDFENKKIHCKLPEGLCD